jgi:putative PIN family toxin of toxin-antitoxin system
VRCVLDTNILVSAMRSRVGASSAIIRRLALGEFQSAISTALTMEYADVLSRPGMVPGYSTDEIDRFIDSICSVSLEARIYFRWRPFLPDPKDDLVFECAMASSATHIVTHNLKDFRGLDPFGVSVVTPSEFLRILGT